MDLRIMQYFLAVVREGNISAASEALHVAQPSLSRQMKELEEELGASLFIRGNRRITLTEEGMVLKKRAEEIVGLIQRTEEEISQTKGKITGTIRIGAGESRVFSCISKTVSRLSEKHPGITVSIKSGDTIDLMDEIGNGILDFAIIFSDTDESRYDSITLPMADTYGILIRKDSPLASKKSVSFTDLVDKPVIISRGAQRHFKNDKLLSKLHITATYNLIYNASLLVEDGLGYAICFNNLINTTGDSPLTFVPLDPPVEIHGNLIWKKYELQSPAVKLFLDEIQQVITDSVIYARHSLNTNSQ